MSEYVGKQQLLAELEDQLRSVLTVTDLEKTQSVMLQLLNNYDVERRAGVEDPVVASRDFVQMFVDAKITEGRTRNTIARYTYILNRFFHDANVTAQETTAFHIRNYFLQEKKRGISDSTIGGYRDVFRSFFGWLFNEELIRKNPCANIGVVKEEKKVRKIFNPVEIQAMIEKSKNLRDKCIILVLLNTGCRVSELCGMDVKDVDVENREVIVHGKGRKERTIYFDTVTAWNLRRYLKFYKKQADEPLFPHRKNNERLTASGVRVMLKGIEKRSKVEDVHPHRFRRTFATNMIDRGMPIQEVAALMGHEKIDTTMEYVYQSKDRVKKSYEHYSA